MSDTDVRDALHRATRHLEPHPGLLADVRRGGHARLVRRRSLLTAGLTAVAVGAGAGQLSVGRGDHGSVEPPFDRPTGGDLAGDRAHLRRILEAWYAHVPVASGGEDAYGDAHVTWTGATPAGPAAFVVQRQRPLHSGALVVGLVVAPGGGRLTVESQAVWTPEQGATYSHAYLIGADRDVLLLRDPGSPVYYSTDLGYRADGRVNRYFRTVAFVGGAAVLTVPTQREQITVAVSTDLESSVSAVRLANVHDLRTGSGRPVSGVFGMSGMLSGAAAAWPPAALEGSEEAERAWAYPALVPYLDVGGTAPYSINPDLHLIGGTPDGRRLLVRTQAVSNGRARVLVVWGPTDGVPVVRYAGTRDVAGPLELALRLPDRQGVVVAAPNATLRHRVGPGPWSPPLENWELLPDATTEVEVTAQGGRPTRVSVR
jgi:hypothetical protein